MAREIAGRLATLPLMLLGVVLLLFVLMACSPAPAEPTAIPAPAAPTSAPTAAPAAAAAAAPEPEPTPTAAATERNAARVEEWRKNRKKLGWKTDFDEPKPPRRAP